MALSITKERRRALPIIPRQYSSNSALPHVLLMTYSQVGSLPTKSVTKTSICKQMELLGPHYSNTKYIVRSVDVVRFMFFGRRDCFDICLM